MEQIEEIIYSAADLVKQLLGFARSGKYEVKPTDINKLIEKSLRMFSRTKKECQIEHRLEESVWVLEVDQSQIEQVLMNLYLNACDSMQAGGTLEIRTENAYLDDEMSTLNRVPRGRYVKIAVSDTGIGMDEATKERIFDPFFTTKEKEKGTGLGLASAYGIIRNTRGSSLWTASSTEELHFSFICQRRKRRSQKKKSACRRRVRVPRRYYSWKTRRIS